MSEGSMGTGKSLIFIIEKMLRKKKWCAQIFSFPTELTLCKQAFQYAIIFLTVFMFRIIFVSFNDKRNQPHQRSQFCKQVISSNHVRRFLFFCVVVVFICLFVFVFVVVVVSSCFHETAKCAPQTKMQKRRFFTYLLNK